MSRDDIESAYASYHDATTYGRLNLTASSASITLTAGERYEIKLVADSGWAALRIGAAAAVAVDQAALATGFPITPGEVRYIKLLATNTVLHGIMSAGTGTLLITRLVTY